MSKHPKPTAEKFVKNRLILSMCKEDIVKFLEKYVPKPRYQEATDDFVDLYDLIMATTLEYIDALPKRKSPRSHGKKKKPVRR